jgi:hypothetical protein
MQKTVAIAFLVVLSACAQKPTTDYDASRDFRSLHKYAWTEAAPAAATDTIINNTLNDQRIHGAVDDVLATEKHMQKGDTANADVLVAYRLVTRVKLNSSSAGVGVGMYGPPGVGLGGTVSVTQYQETELYLDMTDPKTSALIWRGSVKYSTRNDLSPEERAEEIHEKVSAILAEYPPE